MQPNQQVTFLTDGGADVRELPLYLNPQAEHLIDWFHITMRLTVMNQMAKGLEDEVGAEASRQLERLKWFLWHGNVVRALQVVGDLEIDLDVDDAGPGQKLVKTLIEFGGYIAANATWIPNYGERYRHGEAISNAFVESTVNQVVSKRMVKEQQMRWSQRGAHLQLQIRTRVPNEPCRKLPPLVPSLHAGVGTTGRGSVNSHTLSRSRGDGVWDVLQALGGSRPLVARSRKGGEDGWLPLAGLPVLRGAGP